MTFEEWLTRDVGMILSDTMFSGRSVKDTFTEQAIKAMADAFQCGLVSAPEPELSGDLSLPPGVGVWLRGKFLRVDDRRICNLDQLITAQYGEEKGKALYLQLTGGQNMLLQGENAERAWELLKQWRLL